MATEQDPFLGAEDRPEVYTLLDKPVRDLTPREIVEVFSALGIPSAPIAESIGEGTLRDLVVEPELTEGDGAMIDASFEYEQLLAELGEAGLSTDTLRAMTPEALVAEVTKHQLSAATLVRVNRFKRIADKVRRDKPTIDKGIKDAKDRADKLARDGKPVVDKVLKDGKGAVDKMIKDKGRVKDALDAKDIKDLFETSTVTPTTPATNVDELAGQVENLRADFEQLSQDVNQLKTGSADSSEEAEAPSPSTP